MWMRLSYTKRLCGIFLLSIGLLTLANCSPSGDSNDTKCATNADCADGQRCVKRVCTTVPEVNNPPEARITGDKQVRQLSTLKLDGSGSLDPDGHTPLTFAWKFADVPTGSQATIEGADTNTATFTADKAGKFIVELVVTDSKGAKSDPVRHEVDVFGAEQNEQPSANAGPDQVTGVGETVNLDGSNSTDPEGDPLTYEWKFKTKPDGSAADLSDPKADKPTFSPDKPGKYIVELVVNDGLESSDPDTVSIEVLTDFKLQPSVASVQPAEGYSGTTVEVNITGSGFSPEAVVLFDGIALNPNDFKFVNDTTMTAVILLDKAAGDYKLQVRNPNKKVSEDTVMFKIKELPAPEFAATEFMTPEVGITGAKYTITVKGKGFIKGATAEDSTEALFQLVPMPTTVVSDTELTFQLDLSQTLPGEYKVKLRNPGNRSSKEVTFTVLPSTGPPTLRVLNPPKGVKDSKFAFSVHGTGFIQGAQIIFDGKAIKSKRIRRDEIQADPELDLKALGLAEGKYKVWVRNPDGKESEKQEFEVEGTDPTPRLDRILPFFVYLNDVNTLSIYGGSFRPGAKLFLGTTEISGKNIEFRSSSYIIATVDTTKGTWTAGDVNAYVQNANGKKSQTFKLTVTYRIPTISNLTPSGWNTKCDTDVEVYGSNFTKDAILKFGSTTFTTTSTTNKLTRVDDKNLKFKLNAKGLSATTYKVTVENGPSAKSQAYDFRIVSGTNIGKSTVREIRPAAGRAETKVSVLIYSQSSSTGQRFEVGAVVTLNGKIQKTTCSGTSYCYSLTAELDLTGIKPGQAQLRVVNPCNTVSDPVPFLVTEAPDPFISQITPSYGTVGDKIAIAVKGVNFSATAKLFVDGKEVKINVKNDKEILAIDKVDFTGKKDGDTVDIYVDNGNNKKTPPIKYTILDKATVPYISSLSAHELERGQVHNGILITGRGFTKSSEIYFNGDKITAKFGSEFQLTADGIDLKTLKAGTYMLMVKDGSKESNQVPILAKPYPPPVINYTSPSSVFEGNASTTLYIYAGEFCKLATTTTCTVNPKVVVLDPNGTDVSSTFTFSRAYISSSSGWSYAYVYGTLNTSAMKAGLYKVFLELPTGERSNPAPINVKPIPPPTFDRISPTTIYNGTTVSNFYIYATHFCPTSGTRCSQNPIVRILDDKKKDWGSQYNITYTYVSSTGTYAYMRGPLNTGPMQAGAYTIELEHPTSKRKSAPYSFSLLKTPDPKITYIYPYAAEEGKTRSFTLYGTNIGSGAYIRMGLNTVPLTGTSTSSRSFVYDATTKKDGHSETMTLFNANGDKSDPYTFMVTKPSGKVSVTRVTQPMYPGRSYTLYVYGLNWTTSTTPSMLLDGKTFTYSTRYCYPTSSTPYCRYYSFNTNGLSVGMHNMQYQSGTTTSNKYNFWIAKPPAPIISYISPTSTTKGTKLTITFSGSNFITGAFARVGLKTFPLRYSSSTRMYLDNFDTSSYKSGDVLSLTLVNPDQQASNKVTFTIK
ncbi:MAG: hypothetical protein EP343_30245 [Deltaproteobacteria bacterium]|nr:MAG: hypothetical protein EP343_30245 [Deltaproteobacteria bacterium]